MKTVRVRIAVAVSEDGEWYAYGQSRTDDEDALYEVRSMMDGAAWIVEADIPHGPQVIEGRVSE